MKFAEVVSRLENAGFCLNQQNQFKREYPDGSCETIIRDGAGLFDYFYDLAEDAEDIDKANNNITHCDLEWDDLLYMLDLLPYND